MTKNRYLTLIFHHLPIKSRRQHLAVWSEKKLGFRSNIKLIHFYRLLGQREQQSLNQRNETPPLVGSIEAVLLVIKATVEALSIKVRVLKVNNKIEIVYKQLLVLFLKRHQMGPYFKVALKLSPHKSLASNIKCRIS